MTRQTQNDDGRTVSEIALNEDCVREVRNPDGSLVAYRDGNKHVVISRGSKPGTRWTKRVPAERTDVAGGDHLWTIPDNWEHRATIDGTGKRYYSIYHIPETDFDVLVSHPVNCHLVDKSFYVKRVGSGLTADADGTFGTATDVRNLADDLESDDIDHDDPEGLRRVADHWEEIETDLQMAESWAASEGLEQQRLAGQPIHLDNWMTEFSVPQFRPGEVIDRTADLSDLDTDTQHLLDALRDDDLLPSHYRFRISLEETDASE